MLGTCAVRKHIIRYTVNPIVLTQKWIENNEKKSKNLWCVTLGGGIRLQVLVCTLHFF